jgi:hypothetical protein
MLSSITISRGENQRRGNSERQRLQQLESSAAEMVLLLKELLCVLALDNSKAEEQSSCKHHLELKKNTTISLFSFLTQ